MSFCSCAVLVCAASFFLQEGPDGGADGGGGLNRPLRQLVKCVPEEASLERHDDVEHLLAVARLLHIRNLTAAAI